MVELMIGVYGVILWLVFKKFKLLPVNTWTMVGAFLVGAFGLGFILIMMNMYQPLTKDARFVAPTTPIISEVRGRVIEVPVEANTPLKAGDVLFKIIPSHLSRESRHSTPSCNWRARGFDRKPLSLNKAPVFNTTSNATSLTSNDSPRNWSRRRLI
jgi:hypothetical protein